MATSNFVLIVGSIIWFILGMIFFISRGLGAPANWKQDIVWAIIMGPIGIIAMFFVRSITLILEGIDFVFGTVGKRIETFYESLDNKQN